MEIRDLKRLVEILENRGGIERTATVTLRLVNPNIGIEEMKSQNDKAKRGTKKE